MNLSQTEETLEQFILIGIAVRTHNAEGQSMKDIGALTHKFYTENTMQLIPNRLSDDVYCMYTDYESDFMGEYTTIIGCKVSTSDNISAPLMVKEVPACKYIKFTSTGKIMEAARVTWQHIWQSDMDRAYLADFDIYEASLANTEEVTVITYLSIK